MEQAIRVLYDAYLSVSTFLIQAYHMLQYVYPTGNKKFPYIQLIKPFIKPLEWDKG